MRTTFLLLMLLLGAHNLKAQAPNDECANRETIIVTTTDELEYTIDTSTATESLDASCELDFQDNLDVWYEFTMPVNGNVRVTNIPNSVNIALYDSCGGSEIACFSNDGFIFGLDAATDYILRLSEDIAAAGIVNFRVQAFEEITNDECANAEMITVNTSEALEYTIDTRRATESLDASCEFDFQDNLDVWYTFTMPVNGNVRVTNIPNTAGITAFDSCCLLYTSDAADE